MYSNFNYTVFATIALGAAAATLAQNPSAEERFIEPSSGLVQREDLYYKRTPIPVPDEIILEASGIVTLPGKKLLVTTRRGEIWLIEGAYEEDPQPTFTLWANGLHTPLGIIDAPQGGYYVAQRQELTHIEDTDKDGHADSFKTISRFPLSGSYHEYAFGPVMAPNGNLRVTLNVAFGGSTQASVPWRGWMVEITPEGRMTPIAAGLRSPTGFTVTSKGAWIFADNQGEWVGSGRITHIEEGDFAGHYASLQWSQLPGSTVSLTRADVEPNGDPLYEVAKRVPGVKPPAVWLPHTIQGISTAGIKEDLTEGKFGPFAGQFFIADQGQSKIVRMSMEKVKGVWQGASYAFREGFQCGIIRLTFGEDGKTLFAGQTARGWGSVGGKEQGIERLEWTGQVPFEILEAKAQPDGFLLTFTEPVDKTSAADPNNYRVGNFIYKYHTQYGSPPINHQSCPVLKAEVAEDGLSVRLGVACLEDGYVHEINAHGIRSADTGETLVHSTAYYTLNERPYGNRIIPLDDELCGLGADALADRGEVEPTTKNPTEIPASWNGQTAEQSISLGTIVGLKFDIEEMTAKPGERIQLTFSSSDDMLHNWVLCKPGTSQAIGNEAMTLGVAGMNMNFVPESDDVLIHTSLIHSKTTETIYFNAPTEPGDYEYICSFPGHAPVMKGILTVR